MRSALVVAAVLAACEPPGYHKHTVEPDASGSGSADAPKSIDAGVDATTACDHGFRLDASGANGAGSVMITGDFVHWAGDIASGAITMAKGTDGAWTGSHVFAPGSYQYKFILDGSTWIANPANPDTVDDGFGGKNSVYACQ